MNEYFLGDEVGASAGKPEEDQVNFLRAQAEFLKRGDVYAGDLELTYSN